MNRLKKTFLLLGASTFIFSACSDTYDAPDTISDASWYTSQTMKNGVLDHYVVASGDYIAFMDVSQGSLSHEWKIESPNVFLNDKVDVKAPLEDQINSELTEHNDAAVATVLFKNPGWNTVTLHNTFANPVTFHGKNGDVSTVEENGVWALYKEFKVDVFGELAPAFEIQDENGHVLQSFTAEDIQQEKEESQYTTIEVTAGSPLLLVDTSTSGRPNGRLWTSPSSRPATGTTKTFTTKFFRTGTYSDLLMTSKRIANDSVPSGSKEVKIPLIIKVNPSTDPYTIIDSTPDDTNPNKVIQTSENTLQFMTNGVLDPSSLASSANDFTVHVTNTRVIPNVNADISITNVQTLATDEMSAILTLNEPVYEDDVITLQYKGTSLISLDGRVLQQFSGEAITPLQASNSLLDLEGKSYGGFEVTQTNNLAWCWWTGQKSVFSRSTEQAASGSDASCLIQAKAPMAAKPTPTLMTPKINGDFYFTPVPGTYKIRLKVFVDPSVANTNAKFTTSCKVNGQSRTWDLNTLPKGSWQQMESDEPIVLTQTDQQFKISINPSDVTDAFRFFIDDLEIIPIRLRPGEVLPTEPEGPEEGANVLLDIDGDNYGGFDKVQTNNLAWGWYRVAKYVDNFTRSTDIKYSGASSLCVQSNSGSISGKAVLMTVKINNEFLFQPAAGTYTLKMRVKLDPSVANEKVTFGTVCKTNGQELIWDAKADVISTDANGWSVLQPQDIVISQPETQFKITLTSGNISGPVKFYIDDMQLILKSLN